MNELYKKLKVLNEGVYIEPAESFETIINAVMHSIMRDDDVENEVKKIRFDIESDDRMEESETNVKECMGREPVMAIYPYVIATFPSFCLFKIEERTYKADYTYNPNTKMAHIEGFTEVNVDMSISPK